MNNKEKLISIFASTFNINKELVASLEYNKISGWDSVGHMALVTNIEDEFGIMISSEDIMEINSFNSAQSLLEQKYNIRF